MGWESNKVLLAEADGQAACVEKRDGCDCVHSCVSARAPTVNATLRVFHIKNAAYVFWGGPGGVAQSFAG